MADLEEGGGEEGKKKLPVGAVYTKIFYCFQVPNFTRVILSFIHYGTMLTINSSWLSHPQHK
jgi:hypothetical protein